MPEIAEHRAEAAGEAQFVAIVAAVNLARNLRIATAKGLRAAMINEGFSPAEADDAIATWAGYVKDRGAVNFAREAR